MGNNLSDKEMFNEGESTGHTTKTLWERFANKLIKEYKKKNNFKLWDSCRSNVFLVLDILPSRRFTLTSGQRLK